MESVYVLRYVTCNTA